MSKPILSGPIVKPGVRAVLLTAQAIGLELDYKETKLEPKETIEEYQKRKGESRAVILNDAGNIIWESHAILSYLVSKYGKDDSIYPKDFYQRALVDQILYLESGFLMPRARMFLMANTRNLESADKTKKLLTEAIAYFEKILERTSYLAGDKLTIADLSAVAIFSNIHNIFPVQVAEYPKLVDWLSRMENLPYYHKVMDAGLQWPKQS